MSNLGPTDTFVPRHIGPSEDEVREMLEFLGLASLDELTDATVPEAIRLRRPLQLGPPRGEHELLAELNTIASRNEVVRSFIGMGYHDTITRAFLHGVRLFLGEADARVPLNEVVNELLLSPWGRRDWPLRFYSRERLFSVEARRSHVAPDLAAMP